MLTYRAADGQGPHPAVRRGAVAALWQDAPMAGGPAQGSALDTIIAQARRGMVVFFFYARRHSAARMAELAALPEAESG
jgi:hypothetical protein